MSCRRSNWAVTDTMAIYASSLRSLWCSWGAGQPKPYSIHEIQHCRAEGTDGPGTVGTDLRSGSIPSSRFEEPITNTSPLKMSGQSRPTRRGGESIHRLAAPRVCSSFLMCRWCMLHRVSQAKEKYKIAVSGASALKVGGGRVKKNGRPWEGNHCAEHGDETAGGTKTTRPKDARGTTIAGTRLLMCLSCSNFISLCGSNQTELPFVS